MKKSEKAKTHTLEEGQKKPVKRPRKTTQWTAPPQHVQMVLRGVLTPYLRVINVLSIAKRSGDINAVRNFILRNTPIRDRQTWIMMKTAIFEDVAEMSMFSTAINDIKNKIA